MSYIHHNFGVYDLMGWDLSRKSPAPPPAPGFFRADQLTAIPRASAASSMAESLAWRAPRAPRMCGATWDLNPFDPRHGDMHTGHTVHID